MAHSVLCMQCHQHKHFTDANFNFANTCSPEVTKFDANRKLYVCVCACVVFELLTATSLSHCSQTNFSISTRDARCGCDGHTNTWTSKRTTSILLVSRRRVDNKSQ